MKTKPKEKNVLFIRNVPATTKDNFKAWCAAHRITMSKAIKHIMQAVASGRISPETVRRVPGED